MHEDLDITNNNQKAVKFQLEIAVRCDFADIFEVKSGNIVRRGRITTDWSESRQRLRTIYRNGDFSRAVTISPARSSAKAVYANGRLSFEVALEPGRSMADWLQNVAKIQTSNEEFYRLFRQAVEDMAALRLPIAGTDHMVFMPAAALPWVHCPFRTRQLDRLVAEHPVYPEFARGALEILGSRHLRTQRLRSIRLAECIGALFDRFNKAFWDEELGFYGICARPTEEEGADHRIQCRSLPLVRYRAAGARREGSRPR
jgi:glycogen debranching enzyme